jgi:disease resistance protein RPM1
MPDFLVSAATGALSPVLHKLAALLSDEYKRFKGVRGEVMFLIRELEAMHAFLLKKSEEEDPDAQDKAWMKEVRELSYDIEDSLDDFRVRVDGDSTKPDGFIDKCKNLLAKTKARRQIAKAIQDLKLQVKEVSERNQRYKICETVTNTSKVTVDPRALAIFEDASKLVGLDQPKQEVISFLKEDGGISSQQPKIVSIVGIGGLGKTTLANRVYEELKYEFECRAFLSVSRNPDMFKILRTILSEVTDLPYFETEAGSIQQLIKKISEFLQVKRYARVCTFSMPHSFG